MSAADCVIVEAAQMEGAPWKSMTNKKPDLNPDSPSQRTSGYDGSRGSPSPELDSKTSGPVLRGTRLRPGGSARSCSQPWPHVLSISPDEQPPRLCPPAFTVSSANRLAADFDTRRWRWSNDTSVRRRARARTRTHRHWEGKAGGRYLGSSWRCRHILLSSSPNLLTGDWQVSGRRARRVAITQNFNSSFWSSVWSAPSPFLTCSMWRQHWAPLWIYFFVNLK